MYEAHYGFTDRPFSVQPDPAFLYLGPGHKRAFAMLEYGLMHRGGFTVISGEVGAGKTTLIRGACRALGIEEPVTSPTFTIGQRYSGGRLPVSHLDLYRLESLEGEDPALIDDYLGAAGVAFVVWPAVGIERLGRPALEIRLAHAGGDSRTVEIEW
jgi:tRNA threonylcarbamoyladenosine biosynthesis protein TsaE